MESLKSESDGYVCEIIVATVAQNVRDHRMDNKYRLLLVSEEVLSTLLSQDYFLSDPSFVFHFVTFL